MGILILGWVATTLSLGGYYFLVKKNIWALYIWALSNFFMVAKAYLTHDWPIAVNFAAFWVFNFIAIYKWRKDLKGGIYDGVVCVVTEAGVNQDALTKLMKQCKPGLKLVAITASTTETDVLSESVTAIGLIDASLDYQGALDSLTWWCNGWHITPTVWNIGDKRILLEQC